MKYAINISMVYDFESGIIESNDTEEGSVRLSKQASRLLQVLIKNNNQILERNYLIAEVWEAQGCAGSSTSLSVAISEIRKAFRQLNGDPMLIQTLRKVGFVLVANVECLNAGKGVEESETSQPLQPVRLDVDDKSSVKRYLSLEWVRMGFLVAILIVCVIIDENAWFSLFSS
ncbi:DNA-binding transcriptional activator CadC [compost metagenome]|jgi:DNA-binding winged helix-turn-helix (wHTH) protein|uniref:Winged helix-turn-helix domain-containing protein n=1 Tax=Silvania hatchlandensis TaxID=2926469 RepID=A0A9J6Q8M1_9ENTR|nr:winged helix-turn-helix domain-containing protein [Silvania hatchlandensis]MCU6664749.1 winged helix-turn-helix domain-containing protein [Silvania hatchlandensis]